MHLFATCLPETQVELKPSTKLSQVRRASVFIVWVYSPEHMVSGDKNLINQAGPGSSRKHRARVSLRAHRTGGWVAWLLFGKLPERRLPPSPTSTCGMECSQPFCSTYWKWVAYTSVGFAELHLLLAYVLIDFCWTALHRIPPAIKLLHKFYSLLHAATLWWHSHQGLCSLERGSHGCLSKSYRILHSRGAQSGR